MREIAFFLNSPTLTSKDYSNIIMGNPGIAGSEYEFILVSFLLEKRNNDINTYLLTNAKGHFPHRNKIYVKDLNECCNYCIEKQIEILVIDIKYFDKNILNQYSSELSIIIWAHNDVHYKQWNLFSELPYIKRIVNVGREEMELYRDHVLSEKSTFIYNIFPVREKKFYKNKIVNDDNHNVVYMGSIVKMKGFHILARAWKTVIKAIPDANLYVIGSGRLYNQDATLGCYGISDQNYENMFIPYLVDEKGDILPSVHFLGLLGDEKYDELGKCKVGVPNPTGSSETFCICALEMQLLGCNITTKAHPAYYDTVFNKNYLFKNELYLADYIIKRLLAPRDNFDELYNYINDKFGINGNIEKWENLIYNIEKTCSIEPISKNYIYNKRLKDRILKLKLKFGIGRKLPSYYFIHFLKDKIKERLFDILFRYKL